MRVSDLVSAKARVFITATLIVAMLCIQWVGVVHRVVHAEGTGLVSSSSHDVGQIDAAGLESAKTAFDDSFGTGVAEHVCSLFDAAALGSAIHSTPFNLLPIPNVHVLALWAAFASWQPPFPRRFSSRAPPGA